MKKLLVIAVVLGGLGLIPAASYAGEPGRDRVGEAADVASFLGLESSEYRVLSQSEADKIRGTGGCLCLGLGIHANVRANVNLLGAVKVKANVNANVRAHVGL